MEPFSRKIEQLEMFTPEEMGDKSCKFCRTVDIYTPIVCRRSQDDLHPARPWINSYSCRNCGEWIDEKVAIKINKARPWIT